MLVCLPVRSSVDPATMLIPRISCLVLLCLRLRLPSLHIDDIPLRTRTHSFTRTSRSTRVRSCMHCSAARPRSRVPLADFTAFDLAVRAAGLVLQARMRSLHHRTQGQRRPTSTGRWSVVRVQCCVGSGADSSSFSSTAPLWHRPGLPPGQSALCLPQQCKNTSLRTVLPRISS